MPLRYVIDKERRLVLTTGWDRLTYAQTKSLQDQLLNDPDFDPKFNQLIDLTALTGLGMSTEETKALASRTVFAPSSRRAFVATNPAVFGMCRLYEASHHGWGEHAEVRVFSDRDAALEWLGVEAIGDPVKSGRERDESKDC
ncbi:MAG TPA: hypothetical protein VEG68_17160 [Terriglobales bacterium]|nr:hypothetical protein [Terriglobales bacterium]